ncbi:GNAT family N-acetyltransferase, partial [Candidatus Eisenbacteria bacterium]
MKCSFSNDADLKAGLFGLLDTVFPGVSGAAASAAALGGRWEAVSTPFVSTEDGRVISHIGLIELSLIVLGQRIRVGTVHAVATHPDYRRRGHF